MPTAQKYTPNMLQWFTDLIPRLQSFLKIFRPDSGVKGGWLANLPVLEPFYMQRGFFPDSPTTLQSSQVTCGSMNCSMETPGTFRLTWDGEAYISAVV